MAENITRPLSEAEIAYRTRSRKQDQIPYKFWNRVAITADDTRCWNWKGMIAHTGYGYFSISGKTILAHRQSYLLNNGEIPDGLIVRHTCDNRRCVNPSHIILGTHADNSADMVARNRQAKGLRSGRYTKPERTAKGEGCHLSVLKNEDVIEIRKRKMSSRKLAKAYNVHRGTIVNIWTRKTWKHI